MRRLCAIILGRVTLLIVAVVLLVRPALAGTLSCFTYEEPALRRLRTLCNDWMRAVSTWDKTLRRWETTITSPSRKTCTGQMTPKTRPVEMRCR